jgi:hypothetical protein
MEHRPGSQWTIGAVIGVCVALTACGDSPTEVVTEVAPFETEGSTVIDGLLYHVTTTGHDSVLTMDVNVTNQTDSVVILEWGACIMYPRLYTNAQRTGFPAYDFLAQLHPGHQNPATYLWGCPAYARGGPLQPGESWLAEEFRWTGPIRMIFGDSLGPGHYYFSVLFTISGRAPHLDAGDAVVSWP